MIYTNEHAQTEPKEISFKHLYNNFNSKLSFQKPSDTFDINDYFEEEENSKCVLSERELGQPNLNKHTILHMKIYIYFI